MYEFRLYGTESARYRWEIVKSVDVDPTIRLSSSSMASRMTSGSVNDISVTLMITPLTTTDPTANIPTVSSMKFRVQHGMITYASMFPSQYEPARSDPNS
jgi:hypothetical protein